MPLVASFSCVGAVGVIPYLLESLHMTYCGLRKSYVANAPWIGYLPLSLPCPILVFLYFANGGSDGFNS